MRITDFDLYSELIKEKSGIVLTQDKSYLIESRLSPIVTKWGFANFDTMTVELQGVADPDLINDIIEAITSNEASFFRDVKPFHTFCDTVIPYLIETRIHERSINIWSAACSTGQEPYSIAMALKEFKTQLSRWRTQILGTDISGSALEIAENAVYSQHQVQQGLPVQKLLTYFMQRTDKWRLVNEIKKMVEFQKFNLLNDMDNLGEFDVVFCRNVLMYFDDETKTDTLNRIAEQMKDDAFLFIGAKETINENHDILRAVPDHKGLYAKKGSIHLEKAAKSDLRSSA